MSANLETRYSSYVNLTPGECVAKYQNRILFTKAACLAAVSGIGLTYIVGVLTDRVDAWLFLIAALLMIGVSAIEVHLLNKWQLDFFGILTHDADPAKMILIEKQLLNRLIIPKNKLTHKLVAAQSYMLTGDTSEARRMVGEMKSIKKQVSDSALMVNNILNGCAALEEDWTKLRTLRDAIAQQAKELKGARREVANFMLLYDDELLAMADGDYERAEELLSRIDPETLKPQQVANLSHRYGMLEERRGNEQAARSYYEKAAEMGGTCLFANRDREWLATH